MQQAGGEVETSFHAAAVGLHFVASAIGEADERQHRCDRLIEGGRGQSIQRAEQAQVVARRELVVEREILRHQSDSSLHGIGIAAEPHAVDRDCAVIGCDQSGNHRHRRRLAGAVGPQQTDELSAFDIERDAAHGGDRSKRFVKR